MNISYMIYEVERPRTTAQQREADRLAGQTAAVAARLGRSLRHPFANKRDGQRQDGAATSVPRPRTPAER